ncbi:MAG: hypothetical protein LUG56_08810, partial [Lachnospiraceae bacterium]|nr:hypothetical protein [Lachnospiraceae bacterium]
PCDFLRFSEWNLLFHFSKIFWNFFRHFFLPFGRSFREAVEPPQKNGEPAGAFGSSPVWR